MRKYAAIFILTGLIFTSCTKNASPAVASLASKWKMISVTDNVSNAIATKPAGIYTDIVIVLNYTFLSGGKLTGNLTSGTIRGNFIVSGDKTISIPSVQMSWFFDPIDFSSAWDRELYGNITLARNYSFDSAGNLNINCSNDMKLTFIKQ